MTKIKIPVSTMGTPLTEEELKSIVGGRMDKTITVDCVCSLSMGPGKAQITISRSASTPEKCALKCDDACEKVVEGCESVVGYTYTYRVTY